MQLVVRALLLPKKQGNINLALFAPVRSHDNIYMPSSVKTHGI